MSQAITSSSKIEVRETKEKGRGVFARAKIRSGETIEICPVRTFDEEEKRVLDEFDGMIPEFYFVWDEENPKECAAIVLGFGSIYNHSADPNMDCEKDFEQKTIRFYALRDIEPGEELTFDYDVDELWFEPA